MATLRAVAAVPGVDGVQAQVMLPLNPSTSQFMTLTQELVLGMDPASPMANRHYSFAASHALDLGGALELEGQRYEVVGVLERMLTAPDRFVIVSIADAREQWVTKDAMLRTLLASGAAYRAFDTPEELEYYRQRADELGGEILKLDYTVTGLRHELRKKRQAFAVLSELQQSVIGHTEISAVFELAIRAINATLGMDKTVVLVATEREDYYRPSQWLGFTAGASPLLVNKTPPPTPLVEEIRAGLELPYFVCLAIPGDQAPLGLLLSGRLKEAKPVHPPFDQGDIDTFRAIAALISAYMRNLRIRILEETDRLKTTFFANVSHELRTPIALTLGPLEQVLAGRYGQLPDSVRRQLHVMVRNQERLLGQVNQILDLAKLEAGGMKLRAAPIGDMNHFVDELAARFNSLAEKRGIELRLSLDPMVRGAEIFVDRERIGQLFVNLLSNAFKFTAQGSIEVATEIHDNLFRLTVIDTGIGIKQHELAYIFDRFRQADDGESRQYAGTGIGLALVKEIAVLHGGDVRVHSQYGVGSTFQVTVPLGSGHLDPASVVEFLEDDLSSHPPSYEMLVLSRGQTDEEGADAGDVEIPIDPGRPTVLYAEDSRDLRNHVGDLLRGEYNVVLAVDGRDGLEKARRYRPDLVIADQMMPHMSGRDLLSAIRNEPELRSTPVIFLTARAGTEARIESLDAGSDDYLAKPFHASELLARVRNILRVRAQERELARLNHQLADLNRNLEVRVDDQVAQLERLGRLKRFFSPQLAELIVAGGTEDPLKSHRREVVVIFLDLRGFTAFAETSEPEEVMGVLREYHAEMGPLVLAHGGTLERFTGDGMMVFFNDPLPVPDPAVRAVRMAVAMRARVAELTSRWSMLGHDLDFGVGIAQGYATIGAIGFEGRWDYGAIGAVTNLAARLCGEAEPGQILISRRVHAAVQALIEVEPVGPLALKGFHRPVAGYNVLSLK